MRSFARSLGVVLLALAIAGILIAVIEATNALIFPLPAGVVPGNHESMRRAVAAMPQAAFVLVVVAWTVAAFAGAWVATMLADRRPRLHALIVTFVLLAAGLANMIVLPHPAWVWVAAIAGFLVGGDVGWRLASVVRSRTGSPGYAR